MTTAKTGPPLSRKKLPMNPVARAGLDRKTLGPERGHSTCRESITGVPLVHRRRYRARAGHVAPLGLSRGNRRARPSLADGASSGEDDSRALVNSAISLVFPDALSAAVDRGPERKHSRSRGRMYFIAAQCAGAHWRACL